MLGLPSSPGYEVMSLLPQQTADARQNDLLGNMGSLAAHSHSSSPSLIILDDRGRSYRKWPQRQTAPPPTSMAKRVARIPLIFPGCLGGDWCTDEENPG